MVDADADDVDAAVDDVETIRTLMYVAPEWVSNTWWDRNKL